MSCSNENVKKSIFLIFFLSLTFISLVFSESRNLFLNKLANCKGYENASLNWSDVTLERDPTTKDFTFSVKLKVLKEVSRKFGMEFNVWKCDVAGSLDSCEYFLKEYRNDNICNYLVKKHQFWSIFIERFDPPLDCPIKPATYTAMDIPFKSDFLRFLPIKEAVWRARLKGFDMGQTISCVDLDLKLVAMPGVCYYFIV